MNLPTGILAAAIGAILLVIAIPYGLVQMDWVSAHRLRLVPPAIAIILATAFITVALNARRKPEPK